MNSRPFWQHFISNQQNLISHRDRLSAAQKFSFKAGLLMTFSYMAFVIPAYYLLSQNYQDIYNLYSQTQSQLMTGLETELHILRIILSLGAIFIFCSAYYITQKMFSEKFYLDIEETAAPTLRKTTRRTSDASASQHRAS